jgi:hypothetical protein
MLYEDSFLRRPRPDLIDSLERDLSIIHKDVVAVLQETANVRASMTEFSSWQPAASKRFIVVSGMLCFMLIAALVLCQGQLQALMQRIGH